MVEGAPLLREYTRKGIVGSNPIFSATNFPNCFCFETLMRRAHMPAGPCLDLSPISASTSWQVALNNRKRPEVASNCGQHLISIIHEMNTGDSRLWTVKRRGQSSYEE